MIDPKQFRELIVRPVLKDLDMWSQSSENLIMGTFAQESDCGTYIKQLGDGPALGVFQMEPATHEDILHNYIKYRGPLLNKILEATGIVTSQLSNSRHLIDNLRYACAMARVHYYRVPNKLPDANDVEGLAKYWKKFYNTELGKGTIPEFVLNYEKVKL